MDHNHPLWDVWGDGDRQPIATELTLEEAKDMVTETAGCYISCSSCGAPHIGG